MAEVTATPGAWAHDLSRGRCFFPLWNNSCAMGDKGWKAAEVMQTAKGHDPFGR